VTTVLKDHRVHKEIKDKRARRVLQEHKELQVLKVK
tara:strand:- start:708 stop:815 length:108 start_codon:yes stop_codon:yes gene_type:complete